MSTTYFLRPALSQMVPEAFIHLERLIIGMEKMNRGWHTRTKHSLSGLLGKGSKSAGRQLCPFTSLHVAILFFFIVAHIFVTAVFIIANITTLFVNIRSRLHAIVKCSSLS